ncbi:MAG: hypothetical protein V4687_16910 [Bacteroidota bacterium]
MKSKRALSIVLLFSVMGFLSFVSKDNDPLEKLVNALQKWAEINPVEKVYLHMDKPYYAVGDTIWFKAYVTTGSRHQLSAMSGALYVDLINEKDSIVRSLKLPISAGMTMGDFTLDDLFKEGSYRLRAYTQWMRNAGEDYFYDHTFAIGTPVSPEVVVSSSYQYKTLNDNTILTATLNYANEEGKPISGTDIDYDIMLGRERMFSKSAKTDEQGNIIISVSNEKKLDLRGGYIRTKLTANGNKIQKDVPIKAGFAQTDIQFFPESGNLVNGIASKVGFKVTGIDGKGLALKGKVIDNLTTETFPIETIHAGMGSFSILPQSGKTYSAQFTLPDGTLKTVPLPQPLNDGYVLSVFQPNADSILVRINASAKTVEAAKLSPVNLNFIAQAGGETIMALPVKITRASTSFWLEKSIFPSGIAQFTIFTESGEPLNERIAFIKSKDQMRLAISASKKVFKSKELVELNLEARDKADKLSAGNYSVSVIDEAKVPFDEDQESNIFSNLLLTSDLKGYIEKPNYYFRNSADSVNRALDNLMLTQGYRRFNWKEIANAAANIADPKTAYMTNPLFKAEGLGTDISGVVKTLAGKTVPNAKIMLMATKAGILQNTMANAEGRFKFEGLVLTDSIKFAVQARTEKNGTKVEIVLDSVPKLLMSKNRNITEVNTNLYQSLKTYIDFGRKQDSLSAKMGKLSMVQRLREVKITARKAAQKNYSAQGILQIPEGSADHTVILKNPSACANLGTCLQGQLGGGMVFREYSCCPTCIILNYPYYRGIKVEVVLNGRRITDCDELAGIFDQNNPDPEDIVKIDVVSNNMALMNMFSVVSASGVSVPSPTLFIYTNRGLQRKAFNPNIANISPRGFNKVKDFYVPRYDYPGMNLELPDLRSTVYWNPNVKTYSSGKTTLNYFNGDGPGTYKVIVEGINANGELGRAVYRYTVEGDLAKATANGLGNAQANIQLNTPTRSQTAPDLTSNNLITPALDSIRKNLPVEKVYLHTDKPYYNIGDTLWFKGYVLDGTNFTASKQSGLLYVELDDDSAEVVRRISLPIKNGSAWGQIPLTPKIFHEGGFTLRAYTNWMQNFGEDYVFSKRFYLGVPRHDTWLAKSEAEINRVDDKDELKVSLQLSRTDKTLVGLRNVEVKIYEGVKWLYNEKMQTGQDGKLLFTKTLKDKTDGRNIRVEIRNLHEADGRQFLKIPLTINRTQKIDLQFLPEGGYLVSGIKSVVGVKVLSESGRGTDVSGTIYTTTGTAVGQFKTLHNGMGSFEFTPKAGEEYTAKLEQPSGSGTSYKVPLAKSTGTVMKVHADDQKKVLNVQVLASETALNPNEAYYLIGTTRGQLYYSQKIDPDLLQLEIPQANFPSGIARLTLMKGKQPLNERIVFINHNDVLTVKMNHNKAAYLKRDSVGIEIEVKSKSGMPVKGNFSLAVTDDSQVKPDSADNFAITNLLLTSDLKGRVESPGYYFIKDNPEVEQALNNLMLTQGWTGYNWDNVFSAPKPASFTVEKEFKITGIVTNVFNKPVKGAPVLISSQKPSFITTQLSDETGRFTFRNLPQIDSGSFFLQARTPKGNAKAGGDIQVEKFKAPPVPSTFRDKVLPWYVNSDASQINYVNKITLKADEASLRQTGIGLKEVNIISKKIIKGSQNRNGPGNADLIFDEQDIKESGVMNLYQLIKQKLPGLTITFEDALPTLKLNHYIVTIEVDGGGLPLFLDGSPRIEDLKEELSNFQIAQFQGMEVMYSRKYMTRYQHPPPRDYFKGSAIAKSENDLRAGSIGTSSDNANGVFYAPGFKGNGYLDSRVNVLTNRPREIAVITITTRNRTGYSRNLKPDVITYRPLPILYPVEFYSPKYLGNPVDIAEPDYRSTIYWEPNIVTDVNGKARISFYTSDVKGNYSISIEGKGADGILGSAREKIKVE